MIQHQFFLFFGCTCTAVRTAALLYLLLYVVKVCSVGGCRVHCVVRGGWVGRSVRWCLFRPVGDERFFLFIKYRPPTGA